MRRLAPVAVSCVLNAASRDRFNWRLFISFSSAAAIYVQYVFASYTRPQVQYTAQYNTAAAGTVIIYDCRLVIAPDNLQLI